jgi:DNA repair protein RecN (Recombination protein N)
MLLQLTIENLTLVERISLNLGAGLNVLTGETGAGKSIIVDAMEVLVGGRSLGEMVRTGAEKALVEGLFDYSRSPQVADKLAELGLPASEDCTLLLAREIQAGGKSVCRVNGKVTPLFMYRLLGELLVDLHGQHEHQSLLKLEKHRELLDRFGGEEISRQRFLVEELYNRLSVLRAECATAGAAEKKRADRMDYLRMALDEIARLQPAPGEDAELQQESERIRHAEKLAELSRSASVSLTEGDGRQLAAHDLICQAEAMLREMSRYDEYVAGIATVLTEARCRLEDVIDLLRRYREQLEFDPGRAREVEERLYALKTLARKYGPSLADVVEFQEQAAAELQDLEERLHRSRHLEEDYRKTRQEYDEAAGILSEIRRRKAKVFAAAVARELQGLDMPKARLDVRWERLDEPARWGYDQLEFMFSANPGEPLKPLAKIASGGEMSRVMLALKVLFAANDEIPTMIFDEIDTGIGGRTLQTVGDRLAALARHKQVLCVTHSPHIAGRGSNHFYVEKEIVNDQTRTVVHVLDHPARVQELARMLGDAGQTEISRIHAEQILKQG